MKAPGPGRGSGCVGDNYPSSRSVHDTSRGTGVLSGIEASLAFDGPEVLESAATKQRMWFPFILEL
jgi:hypothetical protein